MITSCTLQSQEEENLMTTMHILTYFFSRKSFSEFALDDEIVCRLKKLGFATTFEIQDKTLPITLEGRLAALCI